MNEEPTPIYWRQPLPTDPYQRGDRFHAPRHGGGQMGPAIFMFIFWSSYVLGGFLGIKAGKNHLERGVPMTEAVAKGINAGRRWTYWIIATWLMVGMGLFTFALGSAAGSDQIYDYNGGISLWAWTMKLSGPILWPIMFVIYNRNIDQSLFKRRLLYRVVRPLAHALDRFSSITLYLMIPVVPYAIAIFLDAFVV